MSPSFKGASPSAFSKRSSSSKNATGATGSGCNDLLRRLGIELGLGELVFDLHRSCFLKFDDVVTLLRCFEEEWLETTSIIAILTQPARPELLKKLLMANNDKKETAGCVLSLEPSSHALLLRNRIHVASMDVPRLLAQITTIVNCVEEWRQRLATADAKIIKAV